MSDNGNSVVAEKSVNANTSRDGALQRPGMRTLVSAKPRTSRVKVPQIAFAWKERTVTVPAVKNAHGMPKKILDDAWGAVSPGEMLAILGPSGSGKTTLLNSLVGISQPGVLVEGSVLVGGRPPDATFRHRVSFVQQEDTLMGVLSVREAFHFAARLSGVSCMQAQDTLVNDTLALLGLEECAGQRIGDMFFHGISSGERRRASIGIELMKQPSVIILDEPTSGLDAASAYHVVAALRDLARSGRTIIATIHQPSSEVFAQFDRVCLLARGRMAYWGGDNPFEDRSMPDELVHFLDGLQYICPAFCNPADHALRLVNTDFEEDTNPVTDAQGSQFDSRLDVIVQACATQITPGLQRQVNTMDATHATYADPSETETAALVSTTVWQQFVILAARHWLNNVRNPGVFWIRLAMYAMLSIMIGTLFVGMGTSFGTIQDRVGVLYYIGCFMAFMSIAVMPFFIQMRAVFARERRNGAYEVGPYVVSNFLMSLPGLLLISTAASIMIYFLAGFQSGGLHFFQFLICLFLTLVVAEAFVGVVAALVPHYIVGMAVAAGVFGMFMLVAGFFIQKADIKPWWLWTYYIAFHTYLLRGFVVNEFEGLVFSGNPSCGANPPPITGEDVIHEFQLEGVAVWEDLLVLVAMAVVYQLMFYLVLKYKYRMRVV